LPNYTQTASQELVAVSQNGSPGGTMGSGAEMKQSAVTIGESHIVALDVTSGHDLENGGSGGARNQTEPPGAWFHVDYWTNLVNWTPICANQVIEGSIDFVDPDAPADSMRFYRAVPETGPPLQ
jgi:hypothetical protein